MRILGREPAAIIAAVQSLLVIAVSFGWLAGIGLDSSDDVMIVVAVLSAAAAILLAYKTSATLLAPCLELFKALTAVAALYGFNLSDEQSGAVIAGITVLLGLFQRTQVTPLEHGTFDDPTVPAGPVVPAGGERGAVNLWVVVAVAVAVVVVAFLLL